MNSGVLYLRRSCPTYGRLQWIAQSKGWLAIADASLRGRVYIEPSFFGQMIMNFISLYQIPMQEGGRSMSIVKTIAKSRLKPRISTF